MACLRPINTDKVKLSSTKAGHVMTFTLRVMDDEVQLLHRYLSSQCARS
ncbi:MAG: hypothetical protein AVDCRST_MAG31-1683 [uncultured Sphingomonas sp.]|uniref:Uncharacterized protein n=1 Tax=uncultured Sphingomonas sp. TaxID=158754 RepID=A0A6J4TFI0_9SPHN|nr:MAG: hypothetical protein AVDCRST_MAG31-1683 [uncultured Sphingomonas sp.]